MISQSHTKEKLICGFIYKNKAMYDKAKSLLTKLFGEIDFESRTLAFNYTDYYEKEFGKNLKRKFLSFKKLIPASRLAGIKVETNKIEKMLSHNRRRTVNIDPGYLNFSKLVLASTKDYAYRIYLGKGIYAEITLIFRNRTFSPWEWTYPDYRTPEYISIFNRIREIYAQQIKKQ